ncbi:MULTISPECIES: mannose-6-phosphate isomerase, class I [Planococcus]|uniref:Mannose-6-phosphate isomerase n=2 Tax=Planococcus TaxID=1372 RepID=A0ABM5WUA5_9BACL|nr:MULTISPECIES: mannose-6-phosphate isomerase, class I [Planococcus]ALS77940.1 mannose-6-phosphate isomerase [Planococcus kocurii]AQU80157.1 mannose-6-phosphate isomerase, class I [Planococcus faecalis]OHX54245.1 mannose-6-phosphate isomerase, class I [Planococcus faecalis]
MYKEPVFLKPIFQERIWGGGKLQELFNYDIPSQTTGEAWVISAHENGPSIVMNGELQGMSLSEVWWNYPQLFGSRVTDSEFPLLVKILDANDQLSVQVHPNDQYAKELVDKPSGKTECWYILDCEEDAEIIIGHQAQSREEFQRLMIKGEWGKLFQSLKVKKGDFVYVPSGTLHSIGKGIVILETQQSSDITFRLYDYDRIDQQGKKRELHLEQALAVMTCPHRQVIQDNLKEQLTDLESTRLIEGEFFTVYHWKLGGKVEVPLTTRFLLVSVINGTGQIVTEESVSTVKKGDNFIVPATIGNYFIDGNLEMIVSHT